ncbi:unnamed protein product, partial [Mesorhabditis spiculigera]
MKIVVFCVLSLCGLAYGRPVASNQAGLKAILTGLKFDITDTLPKELLDEFSPDLQEFAKSLDMVDAAALLMLYQKKDTLETMEQVPIALKEISPNTYKKVKKLTTACKQRYEKLTPEAQKLFREHGADGLSGMNGYNDLTTEERTEKLGSFVLAFANLSDDDKESVREQFPVVYKLNTDPYFILKATLALQRQFEKKVGRLRGQVQLLEEV